ncbi:MAG: hypothetical protein J7501_04770 [Bdellovibrio sp.]|nr:hypothetical protein [Bdellovibrio sp.]
MSPESDPYLSDKAAALRTPAPTWQMGVVAGYSGGNQLENDEWMQGPTFAIRLSSLKLHNLPVWDFHFEVNRDNLVGVFAGRRWYCCENDRFNPYLRLAAGTFLDASDQLGNLVELSRFRARAGAGLGEDFFFEMGFGYAVVGPDLYAILGYNFKF